MISTLTIITEDGKEYTFTYAEAAQVHQELDVVFNINKHTIDPWPHPTYTPQEIFYCTSNACA